MGHACAIYLTCSWFACLIRSRRSLPLCSARGEKTWGLPVTLRP